jgi:HEAT repeat protein
MDKNQLKREGLVFGRSFQRAYKLVMLYGSEHVSSEEPLQRCYDSLNGLLKQSPQFTFGFFNRRVVLNELLTPDASLDALEEEFFKRDIAAVVFVLGITLREFKRGLSILATKKDFIEEGGGISVFIQKNQIEGMRIVAAERRPSLTGDTMLGTDLQSFMMAQTLLEPQQTRSVNLDLLLQSAGISAPAGQPASPAELLGLVEKASQAAWSNPEGNPSQVIQAVAHLLEELTPNYLLGALPPDRQTALRGRPAGEVATELAEDAALEWAKRRWAAGGGDGSDGEDGGGHGGGEPGGFAGEEVVRVLGRALQTTQVAERLLQKLGQLVQKGDLPASITERVRDEMTWNSWTLAERHAHMLGLSRFTSQDFRHLTEFLQHVGREGSIEQASQVSHHYLERVERGSSQDRREGMERLPELIRILTGLHSLDFVRELMDRFCTQLGREAVAPDPCHSEISACLAAAAQSLAMFEDFESAVRIGTELEASARSNPERHAECCGQALHNLLNPTTVERLIELSLQKRGELTSSRAIASLLRLVDTQAGEVVFRMLEGERSASGRSRLLHIARQLGDGSLRAARKRLQDERWYVVRNACTVLGALDDPALASHLEPALRHPDARVQQAALTSLSRSTAADRAVVLASALPALPPHLQESVLDELMLLKDPAALDALEGFLLHNPTGKAGVLEKTFRALIAIPDARVVEILNSVLKHGEAPSGLRRLALLALKDSPYPSAQQRISQYRELAPNDPLLKE